MCIGGGTGLEQSNQIVDQQQKLWQKFLKENTNILKGTVSRDFNYSLAQKISSWCPVSHPKEFFSTDNFEITQIFQCNIYSAVTFFSLVTPHSYL